MDVTAKFQRPLLEAFGCSVFLSALGSPSTVLGSGTGEVTSASPNPTVSDPDNTKRGSSLV